MFVGFALGGGGVEGAVFVFRHCGRGDGVVRGGSGRFEDKGGTKGRDYRRVDVEVRMWKIAVDEGE